MSSADHPGLAALRLRISDLFLWWRNYNQLFKSATEQELLNESAPEFWHLIQRIMIQQIETGIAQLIDPPATSVKKILRPNVVPERMSGWLTDGIPAAIASEFEQRLNALKAACSPFAQRRHRLWAHRDEATLLGADSVTTTTPADVDAALSAAASLLNCVDLHRSDTEWAYEQTIMLHDATQVLQLLRIGLRYKKLWRELNDDQYPECPQPLQDRILRDVLGA